MELMLLLMTPAVMIVVATWAWRLHLRGLALVGPGLVREAGITMGAVTARVSTVLTVGDDVLVGIRTTSPVPRHGHAAGSREERDSTTVLYLTGREPEFVARLQRWQVSRAPLLVWPDTGDGPVELHQLHTGQHVSLHAGAPVSSPIPERSPHT